MATTTRRTISRLGVDYVPVAPPKWIAAVSTSESDSDFGADFDPIGASHSSKPSTAPLTKVVGVSRHGGGVCVYCKKPGHIIDACPIVKCRRCKHTGHTERVCKVKERCDKCGGYGHGREAECTRCLKHGHLAGECTLPECDVCGKLGHTTESCRLNLHCEKCDRDGHSEDKCWLCDKCGKHGHLAEVCVVPQCGECGKFGHATDVCWYCTFCSVYGHRTEDCFAAKNHQKVVSGATASSRCAKCGGKHSSDKCFANIQCKLCYRKGHSSETCRSDQWCTWCGVEDNHTGLDPADHFTGECPQLSEHQCTFCGAGTEDSDGEVEPGHLAVVCTSPHNARRVGMTLQ